MSRSFVDHNIPAGEPHHDTPAPAPEFPDVVTARNKLAVTCRYHADNVEAVEAARRALTEAKLAAHVKEALAAAPPLTDAQLARVARLLLGGAGAAS